MLRATALLAALILPLGVPCAEAVALPSPASVAATLSPAATSQEATQRPAVMGIQPTSEGLDVQISQLSPRILTSEEELVVEGDVTNNSSTTLASISLDVFVANETPISIAALTTALSEDEPDATHVGGMSVANVVRGSSAHFEMRIPTSSLPLSNEREWGPRVLTVRASSGEFSGRDRSIMVWDSGAQLSPTRVNAVVPWTSSTATQDQTERSTVVSLAGKDGVTLAVDPLLIPRGPQPTSVPSPSTSPDSSTQSGSVQSGVQPSASPSASASPSPSVSVPTPAPTATDPAQRSRDLQSEAFVASFMSSASEVIALPDGDADLGALALSGNTDFWTRAINSVDAFPSTLRATGWVAPPTPSPTPSASSSEASAPQSGDSSTSSAEASAPTPSASVSPSSSRTTESEAIAPENADSGPTILTNVAWPADATFGRTLLSTLGPNRLTIAPTGALNPAEDLTFTSYARVNVDPSTGESTTESAGAHVLAQNEAISSILGWNTTVGAEGDELDAEQALCAITAIITRERPAQSRTLFAAAPRGSVLNEGMNQRVSALFSSRWVSPLSFTQISETEVTDVERTSAGSGDLASDTSDSIAAMSNALTRLAPLANATDTPDEVYASVEPEILPSLAAGLSPSEQLTQAHNVSNQVTNMLASVSVEPSEAVNLINKSANFPVRVRNNLPWSIRVTVTLIPDDPRLRATPATDQVLAANAATSVEVPVGAIGSGNIEVTYHVATPDGTALDDSQTVMVRMRAGWEDAFTAVIASLFGLLFVAGVVRSLRRRRRSTSPKSPNSPDVTDTITPAKDVS